MQTAEGEAPTQAEAAEQKLEFEQQASRDITNK